MKVLKVVTSFAVGGTERQFVRLALDLDPSRFTVHFGCLRRFGQLLEQIEGRGIPVFDYEVSSFFSARAIAAQLRLARDIRRNGIDLVHTYNFYANVFGVVAAKLAGARVIASIRDMGAYLSPAQRKVQRQVCRLADQVLVNAAAIKEWLVADGYAARNISVIPNGIDIARFASQTTGSIRRELGLDDSAPLVALVGRLAPLKGVEDFLAAAAQIRKSHDEARFLVIGADRFTTEAPASLSEGYIAELKSLVAQLGIAERVVFTGYRSDVERILPELTVSVQPSLSEGLSNTVLESMAAGAAVVATRVGGTGEVVRDGENGLLVPPSSPDAIAAAVSRLLADRTFAMRIGSSAVRSIRENYSVERMVERTSHLYASLKAA